MDIDETDQVTFLPDGQKTCKTEVGLKSKWAYYKQVFCIGTGWLFLFMATGTLRNLQSSINHEDGIGLVSMGTFYGGMMIGSFISSAIVQTLGPKQTLVLSTVFHVIFVAVNFYPNLILLATVGAFAGISHSSLWASQSTYLTLLARSFSFKYAITYESILARFFGISFLFSELSMVFGNPLASLLLSLEHMLQQRVIIQNVTDVGVFSLNNETLESTPYKFIADEPTFLLNESDVTLFCGRHYCHALEVNVEQIMISDWTRNVVVGAFVISAFVALMIFVFTIDDSALYEKRPGLRDLPEKLVGTLHCLYDIKMILIIPYTTFFGFQMAFVSGDVVKAYVSCPVGVHHVGKVMLFYGILDAVSSLVSGWLKKLTGSVAMFSFILLLNSALFLALVIWIPNGGIWSYVLFAGFGCIQGVSNIHINSQFGSLFQKNVESAFSVYRLFLGLGLSVGFTYSPYFCMNTKIWVTATMFGVAALFYYILEIINIRGRKQNGEQTERELEL